MSSLQQRVCLKVFHRQTTSLMEVYLRLCLSLVVHCSSIETDGKNSKELSVLPFEKKDLFSISLVFFFLSPIWAMQQNI